MTSTDRLKLISLLLTVCIRLTAAIDGDRVFRTITASDGIADNSAQTVKCTYSGRMTISTIGDINFYDGARFTNISNDQGSKYELVDYQGHYHLYYDNNHHLWLKSSHGVMCVNLYTERFYVNVDSIFQTYGSDGKRVDDMFVDIDGDVWLCINHSLFCNKYDYRIPLKADLNLQDVEVYDKKYLLLFYEDGLMLCYNLKTGKRLYQRRAYDDHDAKIYNRSGVQLIHDHGLYVIRNGEKGAILLYYNMDSRQWSEVMRSDYHLNNMVVHDKKLYIASEWGYFTYEYETGIITHHKTLTLINGHRLETDINAVEFDLQGGMWLGTEQRGVLYGPPLHAPFQSFSWDEDDALKYGAMMDGLKGITEFRGKKANAMLTDSRNWMWVGTPNGLFLYTSPQAEPVVYSRKNGLLNGVIHAVIEDDMHNIWVSTSYGITCLRIVDDKVKQVFSFSDNDNVPNETFVNGKAMKLQGGTIVMQAIDHVVKFNPQDFVHLFDQKPYKMYPKLTSLLVNGINVTVGTKVNGEVILEKAITRTKEINLNYDQNSVSLTFSALNYARPLQTYYRARIKEISNEWTEYSYFSGTGLVDRRGLLHLPLLALKPGSYHIELQSSVVPGTYEGTPLVWVVNVNQPWWRATFILVFLGLVVLALAVVNFVVYNRNTRMRIRRSNEEGDVIRRISVFVERCDGYNSELLSPTQDEIYGTDNEPQRELTNEFVEAMLKIIPYVHERDTKRLTMHLLSKATNMEVLDLYELMSQNLHKSPRVLVRTMRLDNVAELLVTTELSIEQIAKKTNFVSPNYMMAKFYHKFKMTPSEYRKKMTHTILGQSAGSQPASMSVR